MKIIIIMLLVISSVGEVKAINESKFMNLLKSQKHLFEESELKFKIKQIELNSNRSKYSGLKLSIAASASEYHQTSDRDTNSIYTKSGIAQSKQLSLNLEKTLPLGVKLNLDYSHSQPKKLDERYKVNDHYDYSYQEEYRNTAEISLSVPLLKNFNGMVDKKSYKSSQYSFQKSKLLKQLKKNTIMMSGIELFYKWAYYQEKINAYQFRVAQARRALKHASGKKRLILKNSFTRYQQKEQSLKHKITLLKKQLSRLLPNFSLAAENPYVNWDKNINFYQNAAKIIKKSNLDLKIIKFEQKVNFNNLRVYRNSKLPELNLTVKAQGNDVSGVFAGYSKERNFDYEVRVDFKYKIFADPNIKSKLAKSKIKTRQLQIKYNNKFNSILDEIIMLSSSITQSKKDIKLLRSQLQSDKNESSRELTNYRNVRSLIKAQNNVVNTKLDLAKAMLEYNVGILRYKQILNLKFY